MEYIYALKCQKDKFYIGQTYNVQIEYNEHLDGTFCDLTKEFKPCDIDSIFEVSERITLNLIIAIYINKYGKKNVYFQETNKKEISKLRKNKDFGLVECELNLKDKFWTNILNKVVTNLTNNFKKSRICYRCGRYGHDVDECYATTHIEGQQLDNSDECDFT